MINLNRSLIVIFFALVFLLFTGQNNAFAQQTIFNVPSADLTEKNMIFFQHQSTFSGRFGEFDNNFVFGLGKNTEFDLTLFNVGTKNIRNEVLALGFKSILPLDEKTHTKFTFGHLIPISLRRNGVGGYSYSHISTVLPKLHTRITSGIAVGTTTLFDRDFICFIAGIEHPITKKLSFVMDWYSGKHSNGFLIPGFYYSFTPKLILSGGYRIRNNTENGHNGFIIELSKFF